MDPVCPRPIGRSLFLSGVVVIVAFASLLVTAPFAAAASTNYIAGSACAGSSTPRWQSGDTWIMYGNVTVVAGCTLTIEPGAIVKADPAVHLYVDGQLLANGTSASTITFDANRTNLFWGGVQFNASSRGSYLQYASLRTVERAVRAVDNPLFWGPWVQYNVIDRAIVGVELENTYAYLYWTRINDTRMGVRAHSGGSPLIIANTITAVEGNPAVGVFVTDLDSPTIQSNTIRWVNGTDGANGVGAGVRGRDGGIAVGVLVNGTNWANVAGNTIDQILGGRGGNGGGNAAGDGGDGGAGGPAAAIVFANTPYSRAQTNRITNVIGGHGGNGGPSSALGSRGGGGGAGGSSFAAEAVSATLFGWLFYNTVTGVAGGSAGDGGTGSGGAITGRGGVGADAYGFFVSRVMDANASNNVVQTLRGGYGGNGSAGGAGGQVSGLSVLGADGSTILRSNTVTDLTGGVGGGGSSPVAPGGNATGILAFGDSGYYNVTTIADNQVTSVTGGLGGVGGLGGSAGGNATGIAGLFVQMISSKNRIQDIIGGQGGSTGPGRTVGQGGSAGGLVAALVPSLTSALDRVQGILPGAQGSGGNPATPTYGFGFYAFGDASTRTTSILVNDTFATVNDFDLFLDNSTETTTLNTTFSSSKLFIAGTANLTVQNFLAVRAYWPNNVTPVASVRVTVLDNGKSIYDGTSLSGAVAWIVAANRVYTNSPTPVWNETEASVSYLSYTFDSNPRAVNLTASRTEVFWMVDTTPPTSSANSLPAWTASQTFPVPYTYSDGFGVGVKNITLWYRLDGGTWLAFGTQDASGAVSGAFTFSASNDGTYEFATTAIDEAGNMQTPVPPIANHTVTIVDTTRPNSQVTALPAYETSVPFTVSWGPASGTMDIASYTIQFNRGSGWQTWLSGTTTTSGTFTPDPAYGVYQFRSIATDYAGNVEPTPVGNDTWTIVDLEAPASVVVNLPAYESALSFSVSWQPQGDSFDIATYRIDVKDNGGAWTTWIASTDARSAVFDGLDGHTYEFRSIASDYAGNVEPTPTGNDTWTLVDVTAPDSRVGALPTYTRSLVIPISWGPAPGTVDIATFTVDVSDNDGLWTAIPGYVDTTATSGAFNALEGHRYAFRAVAKDRAGNVEMPPAGNDTWTVVDTVQPFATTGAPRGANVNTTPLVTVTFSEPMDRLATEAAFSITPDMSGAFTWSADSRVLTFLPDRALEGGRDYVVFIDSSAKDAAGNTMLIPFSFSFSTVAAPIGGSFLADMWWLFLAIGVAAAAIALVVWRRRQAPATTPAVAKAAPIVKDEAEAIIEDVFLLYHRDGILIKHETRRLRPDVDSDILSGMLTAVQQFVKDALRGDDYAELNEMTVGHMHILIARGKWLVLAARIEGDGSATWTQQTERCIKDMEDHHWDQLEDWDGDMNLARLLTPYVKKLIRGEYA